ncbi:hypothetical protein [Chondrinema litorale]|uniref:hypothetical protein n=1 Tax=Chondrinema litorale TaxID=2994555 RepID=UPI002543760C|nr:hypothetical protein [Chondrinema litorale]UZR98572.1 hypothetical protein OQ292_32610 [Chondrinema litorale]
MTPDCGVWEPFKKVRDILTGKLKLHYDSLVRPTETITVSYIKAYDFGMSYT